MFLNLVDREDLKRYSALNEDSAQQPTPPTDYSHLLRNVPGDIMSDSSTTGAFLWSLLGPEYAVQQQLPNESDFRAILEPIQTTATVPEFDAATIFGPISTEFIPPIRLKLKFGAGVSTASSTGPSSLTGDQQHPVDEGLKKRRRESESPKKSPKTGAKIVLPTSALQSAAAAKKRKLE